MPLHKNRAPQPDLTLIIDENENQRRHTISFRLYAPDSKLKLNCKEYNSPPLETNLQHFFKDFFEDVDNPHDIAAAQTRRRMACKGAYLFETLFPKDLQDLLWSLQDHGRSLQILSKEPWIPWELCKLQKREASEIEEGPFFCEAFVMTRWMPGVQRVPRLAINNLALVVVDDGVESSTAQAKRGFFTASENNPELSAAGDERDYLLSLANERRNVDPIQPRFLKVIEGLARGRHDAWHFTGHGFFCDSNPDRSIIQLDNKEQLRAEDVSGRVKNLGKSSPLVFFNTRHAGRSDFSLTGVGGWANQFLSAGAGAFVGAYWSITDEIAYEFARVFYDRLLEGTPFGEAVREARLAIKKFGGSTWLAYTAFGDPTAVLDNNHNGLSPGIQTNAREIQKEKPDGSARGRDHPRRERTARFSATQNEYSHPRIRHGEKKPGGVWGKKNAIRFLGLILVSLLLVVLRGLDFNEDFFEVTIHIHEEGAPGKHIENPGLAILLLDKPRPTMFTDGYFKIAGIPAEVIGKTIRFQISAKGYELIEDFESTLERSKIIYIPVRKKKGGECTKKREKPLSDNGCKVGRPKTTF